MKLINFAAGLIVTFLLGYLLFIGKAILLPLIVAVIVWYLINALRKLYTKQLGLNAMLAAIAAIATLVLMLWGIGELVSQNIGGIIKAAPSYQKNFQELTNHLLTLAGLEQLPSAKQFAGKLNLPSILSSLVSGLTSLTGNVLMVAVYVAFLLIEQKTFAQKIAKLFPNKQKQTKARNMLADIDKRIRDYIWIKTLISISTGVASYVIMRAVGLDFAAFWAVIISILNYIPTFGSILGTLFPILFAILQFTVMAPVVIIAAGIGAVQITMGNVIEPRLMGKTLNLSPIVILLSLVTWGSLWGVVGMFVCVPMMVILTIILAKFEATRPVAILLSQNGKI